VEKDQRGFALPGGGVIRLLPEGFCALFLPAEMLPAPLLTPPAPLPLAPLPVVLLPAVLPVVVPFTDEPLADGPPVPLCADAKGPVTASAAPAASATERMIVAGFMVWFP
jgi:hypothetical protein